MLPLVGHQAVIQDFLEALQSSRMHHAWLLTGPEGIGKSHFARLAALKALALASDTPTDPERLHVSDEHVSAKLMRAESHPDFMALKRLEKKDGAIARNISIDQIRSLHNLFETTGSYSSRRVVLVDSVDDLESGGANALLKSLEEPPSGALFLLISHSPGRLLPTIRSRCRTLRMQPLSDQDVRKVIQSHLEDVSQSNVDELVAISKGAPGIGLRFAGLKIGQLDMMMDDLILHGDPHGQKASEIAKALSSKAARPRFMAFLERAPIRVASHARRSSGTVFENYAILWEELSQLPDRVQMLSLDPQATTFTVATKLAALAPAAGSAKG